MAKVYLNTRFQLSAGSIRPCIYPDAPRGGLSCIWSSSSKLQGRIYHREQFALSTDSSVWLALIQNIILSWLPTSAISDILIDSEEFSPNVRRTSDIWFPIKLNMSRYLWTLWQTYFCKLSSNLLYTLRQWISYENWMGTLIVIYRDGEMSL